jgi:uncharacterized protein (DUF3820 family)
MYDWDTVIEYGRYKLNKLRDIPTEYLLGIWKNNKGGADMKMRDFLANNFEVLESGGVEPSPKVQKVKPFVPPVFFICDKKTFATKQDARNSLKKIRQVNENGERPIRVYECEFCSGWHLTKMTTEEYKNK